MRTDRGIPVHFLFAPLNDQYAFCLVGRFRSKVLHFCLIVISQIIEPQTVPFFIHDRAELMLQHFSLCLIDNTFKHRILDTLAIINALFCDLPQSFAPCGIFRVYIIGN